MTGLRDVLGVLPIRAVKPMPSRVAAACDAVDRHFAAAPKAPPEDQLRASQARVLSVWRSTHKLDGLERRDGARVPWFVFCPVAPEKTVLGADEAFADAYIEWIRRGPVRKAVRGLYHAIMLHYPTALSTFESWRAGVLRLVREVNSPRVDAIRATLSRHELFGRNAPEKLAEAMLRGDASVAALIDDCGLRGELRSGAFARAMTVSTLDRVARALERGGESAGTLESLKGVIHLEGGELVFGDLRALLATRLLLPFHNREPEVPVRKEIQVLLLRHLRDPRVSEGPWLRVDPDARGVMLRWLVDRDLAFFFDVISQTADPSHWKYRKAFWKAYLERGAITAAWVVLGRNAMEQIRRKSTGEYGRLQGGVESNKSLLLMQIGDLTVAEWSHSGKCRAWPRGARRTPELYQKSYDPQAINTSAAIEIVHHGSASYGWQERLAVEIAHYTGIRVRRSEYIV